MKDINLLNVYQPTQLEREKLVLTRKTKAISLTLIFAYCLLIIVILSWGVILKQQSRSLNKKIETQKQSIAAFKPVESLFIYLKQGLAALTPIFAQREIDERQVLDQLEDLAPDGVTFEGITFSQAGQWTISGTARDVNVMSNLLEIFSQPVQTKFAKDIELSSASRGEDGKYTFGLNINVIQ